ncbi:dTDP-4-amino-4,6-dideoxygalactose transaminase [Pontibacter ummariensis]|uniref:dTDP-4-amino-4,6-dideoxygalactose transaminase n=2 Tax=Pontibacter ummariensis TaxID=1610492 RepID=A0A239DI73_9BACT|nr:dTDP-4-amino-4,6-dideoxygalactose transaminase [Pontibacter ummariensis]SNS31682.1 dTDP-4-amino-4,6-dideoxygalactose transaminase [Pontibacter ummariensis]
MADEKALYAKHKPELDAAFSTVMEQLAFEDGPHLQQFAQTLQQYLQVPLAIPCASGVAALQLALLTLDLKAGAEVILPAFSYEAGAEVVSRLGLLPVFADVLPDTFTLDPVAVERATTAATAVIVPVHLFGQCADMDAIMAFAQQHQLYVVEDATQALGATFKRRGEQVRQAGSIGHMGITSFFSAKPFGGVGDGGALLIKDKSLAEKAANLLRYDQTGAAGLVADAKLENLQAALLDVKMKYLTEYHEGRKKVVAFYDRAFAEVAKVQVSAVSPESNRVYQQYTIKVPSKLRDGLQQYLRDNFVPSVVYYPQPLHRNNNFAYVGYQPGDFPVAESLSQSLLSLPLHAGLKEDQLAYICQHVKTYVKQNA